MFDDVKLKEQAYNPALSVLRLSKKYGEERLEAACGHALPRLSHPRYKHVKAILDSGLDRDDGDGRKSRADHSNKGGHLRGADYYKG